MQLTQKLVFAASFSALSTLRNAVKIANQVLRRMYTTCTEAEDVAVFMQKYVPSRKEGRYERTVAVGGSNFTSIDCVWWMQRHARTSLGRTEEP